MSFELPAVSLLLLNGLVSASSLFVVASGLSIVFGVTRIVNFAHGGFYMLGAYLAYSLVTHLPLTPLGFWAGTLTAALVTGLLGVAMETLVLRRIYRAPELFQLLATFGVALVIQDVSLWVWGGEDLMGPRAPGLSGSAEILGLKFPQYNIVLIAMGPVVLGVLWGLLHKTRWGRLVRAATQDRMMIAALGVNQKWLFSSVFFIGALLAGLGGAVQMPSGAAHPQMDLPAVAEAFVVVVVGGLGSVGGAFLAALLIGMVQAVGFLVVPKATLVLVFLVMAAVLILRPHGLLGKGALASETDKNQALVRLACPLTVKIWGGILLLALAAPLVVGDYALVVLTEGLVLILFATSLHLLTGPGGMISFGHAAYFGLGAYGAGLLTKKLAVSFVPALAAAPLIGGAGALIFGWFCVRLSGVYLAMLTLAFAQIVWSVAFQWYDVTGGDNGLPGIWPSAWASSKWAYYYLSLALVIGGLAMLRRIVFAPFGYGLRAGRDSLLRADAIGIDVRRHRWLAFSLAGAFAGLAGALYSFAKGIVFPQTASIPMSVDGLAMVLLGGIQSLAGPIAGAAVFFGLQSEIMRITDHWRAILGLTILALVIAFPQGLAGFGQKLWRIRWKENG